MPNYWNNETQLGELVFAVLNGTADDDQHAQLEQWLSTDPDAMQYYSELVTIYSALRLSGDVYTLRPSSDLAVELGTDAMLWHALAESEKTAIEVKVETPEPEMELQTDLAARKKAYSVQRRISKLSLYTAV